MSVTRRRQDRQPSELTQTDAADQRAAEDVILPVVSSTVVKLIVVLVLLIINLVAFLYAGSDLDTLDPQRYYAVLDLPPGVKRISSEDITAAYNRRAEEYLSRLEDLHCADVTAASSECDAEKEAFEHLKKAYEVLGDKESRIDYDRGYQNYFRLLGLSRDATLEELSTAHKGLTKETKEQFDSLDCERLLHPHYLPSSAAPTEGVDVQAARLEHLHNVDRCRQLKRRQEDLAEAWHVLGHETSRQVYQNPRQQEEALSFISSPLKAVHGFSWLSFVFPALTVLAVVFVVTQVDLKNMVNRQ